jgi:DNA-binding transcriptional LysR family regulator
MNERLRLSDLTAFATVAAHKSFRKAAEDLRVSPSTLSHGLRTLESRLGVRLLQRTTRSVAVTDVGQSLLTRLQPVFRDLDAALAEVDGFGKGVRGTLRINANMAGARLLLARAVPAFLRRYPQVHLDLVTEGRLVDIVAEGFDAGVRLRESVPEDMIAVPFGGDSRFVAVAAPRYLKEHPAPRTPRELRRHQCIQYRTKGGRIFRWEFERQGKAVTVDVAGPLTLNDDELMAQAAADGMGIAYISERLVSRQIAAGKLVAVLGDWSPRIPGLVLYYPGHRQVPPALRAFVDVLRQTQAPAQEGKR